jgi:hypothetical protein
MLGQGGIAGCCSGSIKGGDFFNGQETMNFSRRFSLLWSVSLLHDVTGGERWTIAKTSVVLPKMDTFCICEIRFKKLEEFLYRGIRITMIRCVIRLLAIFKNVSRTYE